MTDPLLAGAGRVPADGGPLAPGEPLVRVADLRIEFPVRGGARNADGSKPVVHAVDGVSFDL